MFDHFMDTGIIGPKHFVSMLPFYFSGFCSTLNGNKGSKWVNFRMIIAKLVNGRIIIWRTFKIRCWKLNRGYTEGQLWVENLNCHGGLCLLWGLKTLPSRYLLLQSQQRKPPIKVWNLLKVNNKGTRTWWMTSIYCLCFQH